jgi:hypothetical protein
LREDVEATVRLSHDVSAATEDEIVAAVSSEVADSYRPRADGGTLYLLGREKETVGRSRGHSERRREYEQT